MRKGFGMNKVILFVLKREKNIEEPEHNSLCSFINSHEFKHQFVLIFISVRSKVPITTSVSLVKKKDDKSGDITCTSIANRR